MATIPRVPQSNIASITADVDSGRVMSPTRIRNPGGGRKRKRDRMPSLVEDMEMLFMPVSQGDMDSPLRWTIKSLRQISDALRENGHEVSHRVVGDILRDSGYSLQGNQETLEGKDHSCRDAQFQYINNIVKEFMASGDPVIAVDTRRKKLAGVGENKKHNPHFQGCAGEANPHDFPAPGMCRAPSTNAGNPSWELGVLDHHDAAAFVVFSILRWWDQGGSLAYPSAKRLLITAAGSGSYRTRLHVWKGKLRALANKLEIPISVSHFLPGTSKWNNVGHRLFSFTSIKWRDKPVTDYEKMGYETIMYLISHTATCKELPDMVNIDKWLGQSKKDAEKTKTAKRKSKRPAVLAGDWNYTIYPSSK